MSQPRASTDTPARGEFDATGTTDGTALSIVIIAYNEAENLKSLLPDVYDQRKFLPQPFEVLLIDDGSTDDTPAVGQAAAGLYDELEYVRLAANFGQSAALAAGFDVATGDIIVPMDGDGQNDPAEIPALVNELLDRDVACVSGQRADRNDPLLKRVPSKIQTALAKFTGPSIHDFGCTLKAYDADAVADIHLYGEGHRYIPAKLYSQGYDIAEQTVKHRQREHGESHYGVGRLLRGFVDLVYHWFWVRYSTRPMHIFGSAGLLCFAAGVGIGGVSVLQRYLLGVPLGPRTPRLILTIGLVLFGVHLLMFGVLTEQLTKLLYDGETTYRIEQVVK